MLQLTEHIRDIRDWPKPGIVFKDITPLLSNPAALAMSIEQMANPWRGAGIDKVCGAESRGFIFGTAVAQALSAGFIPIRKPGKLPHTTCSREYDLEYGTDCLEVHTDAVAKGDRVLIVDDLLATGGTLRACCEMIDEMGAEIVGVSVLVELAFLPGRQRLAPYDQKLRTVIQVDEE